MRSFEEDFPALAEILGKEHLIDLCEVQTPAILTQEINTREVSTDTDLVEFIL